MVKKILIWFFCFLILTFYVPNISIVKAGSLENNLIELQELSKTLYQTVKIKDYEKAKLLIEEISNIFPSYKYDDITTVEGIEAITSTIIHTKRNLVDLKPNYKNLLFHSTQLYLAFDALNHSGQPLWHRYNTVIQQDLETMKSSIQNEDKNIYRLSLQNFQLHYMLIKPAIYVSDQPQTIEKIDSLITALINQNANQNKEIILNQLKISIHQLFYGNDEETFGIIDKESVIWETSLGMGLIIFLVLSYVIWRKFKGAYFYT